MKVLRDLTETDLQHLVEQGISESKLLDFKLVLELENDQQKREFLADVTAFANTEGGELIYGIREKQGVAEEVVGLRNFNADARIGQMENLLRDFVQPRIFGVEFHAVPISGGNQCLVVRVRRSLNSPHMIRHQNFTRFCGRNANGKFPGHRSAQPWAMFLRPFGPQWMAPNGG